MRCTWGPEEIPLCKDMENYFINGESEEEADGYRRKHDRYSESWIIVKVLNYFKSKVDAFFKYFFMKI